MNYKKILVVVGILLSLFPSYRGQAQTSVSTGLTGSTATTSASGVVVFGITNSNTYPIAVTQIANYHNTTNNGKTYTVWYNTSTLTGAPNITIANGWTQLATSSTITATTSSIVTILNNQYLVIPGNTTYRLAIVVNSGNNYFATSGSNSYTTTGSNVSIQTGSSTISPGYAGTMPTPTLTPRYFAGSITFVSAVANNLATIGILNPITNTQYCSYDSALVKAIIFNNGSAAQTGFPISAYCINSVSTASISTIYQGNLAPYAKDTVIIGKINAIAGTYNLKVYTQLATDTIHTNDTSSAISITFKSILNPPNVHSDTVCLNGNASTYIFAQSGNTYNWYSAANSGTLLNIGNVINFPNLTHDTIMYVSTNYNGCESVRKPIGAIVGTPPSVHLGADTSFCQSIPLILDAENPGAKYLWSTGDTTQTITVKTVSGTYWVKATKYCTRADTINVTIAPLPHVSGISYIRNNNTYHFTASSVQHVTDYLWIFGDGTTSNLPSPTHTYAPGINVNLVAKLVVSNECSTDTVKRTIPTDINDLDEDISLNIFPNPAHNAVTINSDKLMVQEIQLINSLGSIVFKMNTNNNNKNTIDISNLSSGNYFVRIVTDEKIITRPLQIIK